MPMQLTSDQVWQAIEKELFAVLGMVTAQNEVAYGGRGLHRPRAASCISGPTRPPGRRAMSGPIPMFPSPSPSPNAFLSCPGSRYRLPPSPLPVWPGSYQSAPRRLSCCKPCFASWTRTRHGRRLIHHRGDAEKEFVTYGVGVSLMQMRHPEQPHGARTCAVDRKVRLTHHQGGVPMKAMVVYDSRYGNTERIAHAIGAGLSGALGAAVSVAVVDVGVAHPEQLAGLGSCSSATLPTAPDHRHRCRTSSIASREGDLNGVKVAALHAHRHGQAGRRRAYLRQAFRSLRLCCATDLVRPLRKRAGTRSRRRRASRRGTEGPLADGELERAAAMGQAVGGPNTGPGCTLKGDSYVCFAACVFP